ncbi:MAG: alpha-galactosidase [Verrucomicrobiota bacterium]
MFSSGSRRVFPFALGVELSVIDDGWFGKGDRDRVSLGDWTPSLRPPRTGRSNVTRREHLDFSNFAGQVERAKLSCRP